MCLEVGLCTGTFGLGFGVLAFGLLGSCAELGTAGALRGRGTRRRGCSTAGGGHELADDAVPAQREFPESAAVAGPVGSPQVLAELTELVDAGRVAMDGQVGQAGRERRFAQRLQLRANEAFAGVVGLLGCQVAGSGEVFGRQPVELERGRGDMHINNHAITGRLAATLSGVVEAPVSVDWRRYGHARNLGPSGMLRVALVHSQLNELRGEAMCVRSLTQAEAERRSSLLTVEQYALPST